MDDNKELKAVIFIFIVCITLLVIGLITINHIKIPFMIIFLWGAITPFLAGKIAEWFCKIN